MNKINSPVWVSVLTRWYEQQARPLPWRDDPTPYRVWVSEIMLQQTRIEAVLPYYDRFIRTLPTVQALADVSDDVLMKLWEGLGYYSRARNLKKAAQTIVEKFGGELPADFEKLRSLAGIGEYTAGAIGSIAFGLPVPAVDGNVMRVLSRLQANEEDIMLPAVRKRAAALLGEIMPHDKPGTFNQAIMELGERVCLPNTVPLCDECPLASACLAYRQGTTADFPVRVVKTKKHKEKRTVYVLLTKHEKKPMVLLHRRPNKGLLAGLWELPNRLTEEISDDSLPFGFKPIAGTVEQLPAAKHVFSHVEWYMTGVLAHVGYQEPETDYRFVTAEELLQEVALPSAFRAYAQMLPQWLK